MEDDSNKQIEVPSINKKQSGTENRSNKLLIILTVLTAICVVFSALVGAYAFKVNKELMNLEETTKKLNQDFIYQYNEISETSNKFETLSNDFGDLKEKVNTMLNLDFLTVPGMILLDSDGVQTIDATFRVVIESVEESSGGSRVIGYIINTDGCEYRNIEFHIKKYSNRYLYGIGTKSFIIPKVRPGYAAKFSVFVPNVSTNDIVWMYQNSSYYFHYYIE